MLCAAMVLVAFAAPIPEIGKMAPTVVLPSQDGSTVDDKKLHGAVGGAVFLSQRYDSGLHH